MTEPQETPEQNENTDNTEELYPAADALAPEENGEASDPRDEQIKLLEAQVGAFEKAAADSKEQMLRVAADAENTKRRALKERDDAGKYAVSSFAKDLLDVASNLRRALEAVDDDLKQSDQRIEGVLNGVEATEREMLRAFEKHGIEKMDPHGEIFDPNLHEVMFETPGTGQPGGTIIQVVDVGYMLKDRLLRPARVGVAKDEGNTGTQDPGVNIDVDA